MSEFGVLAAIDIERALIKEWILVNSSDCTMAHYLSKISYHLSPSLLALFHDTLPPSPHISCDLCYLSSPLNPPLTVIRECDSVASRAES